MSSPVTMPGRHALTANSVSNGFVGYAPSPPVGPAQTALAQPQIISPLTTFTGSAGLTGLGTLTASPQLNATGPLSGLGSLGTTPELDAVAALTGLGSLSATPVAGENAALSGLGSLSAALTVRTLAGLTGTGTLGAVSAFSAAAALSGTGSLTPAGVFSAAAALSGAGSLAATPTPLPSVVQEVSSRNQTATSIVLTVGNNAPTWSGTMTAGNTMVMGGRLGSAATVSGTITDTQGNTWTVDEQGSPGSGCNTFIAHAVITTALVAGNTITVPLSASAAGAIGVVEVVSLTGAVDQVATVHATGTSVTAATATNSSAGDFVFSVGASNTNNTITLTTSDPDSGGTWADSAWPYQSVGCDFATQLAGPASLFSVTWTNTSAANMSATTVTYKAVGPISSSATMSGVGTLTTPSTVAGAATLSGLGTLTSLSAASVPRVGAYITPDPNGTTWVSSQGTAEADWVTDTARPITVERFYLGTTQSTSVPSAVANAITNGRKCILGYNQLLGPVSGVQYKAPLATATTQATLDSTVNSFCTSLAAATDAAGLTRDFIVFTLWHEPYTTQGFGKSGNASFADYITMFQHYGPIIQGYGFKVSWCTSAGNGVAQHGEDGTYPGDSYVDIVATDYYTGAYQATSRLSGYDPNGGGGGNNSTYNPFYRGDNATPPKPCAIYETGGTLATNNGITVTNFVAYVKSAFQYRKSQGLPNADICWFNSGNDANNTPILGADGTTNSYESLTEYRNALFQSLFDAIDQSGNAVGTSAMSGSGTLSAAPILPSSAGLSGAGTLGTVPVLSASAALSGLGTLTAAYTGVSSAPLSGQGSLSAAPVLSSAAPLAGLGTLGAAGVFAGAAALTGTGALAGAPVLTASAALAGLGSLPAAPVRPSAGVLAGTGQLSGGGGFLLTVAMSGQGSLAASWQLTLAVTALLSGQGLLGGPGPVIIIPGNTGTIPWLALPAPPRWQLAIALPRWTAAPAPPRWEILMATFQPISALSLEEINITWTSALDGTVIDPTVQPLVVQFAVPVSSGILAAPAQPVTWYAASWLAGGTGFGYIAQGLVGPGGAVTLVSGQHYDVWGKLLGSPEQPVKFAGQLAVY